ncbi:hypothetical protein [Tateyamaria sp. SN3-11]|uniref:hypothetical protein n=1 Tax=Tateyamaria sp. SN3-11 TaxID=3092147 RepID=UPI0039E8931B
MAEFFYGQMAKARNDVVVDQRQHCLKVCPCGCDTLPFYEGVHRIAHGKAPLSFCVVELSVDPYRVRLGRNCQNAWLIKPLDSLCQRLLIIYAVSLDPSIWPKPCLFVPAVQSTNSGHPVLFAGRELLQTNVAAKLQDVPIRAGSGPKPIDVFLTRQ